MNDLRIALVVPTSGYAYDEATLRAWIRARDVDLVAFPEGFVNASGGRGTLSAARQVAVLGVKSLAEDLAVPVLAGVWCEDVIDGRGMQCAGYWNPKPKDGDTRQHFYAKHSTSAVLPYELSDYTALRDAMFEPIQLRGRKLGIQLCHDQFFGLISARLVHEGADVLIDLTGRSVVRAKWFNVVAGRSLEHRLPYFCTMSHDNSKKTRNVALAFGFRDGAELTPLREKKDSRRNGALALFALDGDVLSRSGEQPYSSRSYNDVTLALAPSTSRATIRVDFCQHERAAHGSWRSMPPVNGHSVGMLALPADALRDPLCIYAHERGESPFDVNVVCFTSPIDALSRDEAIILARLRAIEHRVAIVICTPTVREVIKTNRYKSIQRIQERDGVFGLDLHFLGGTFASMEGSEGRGIPRQYQPDYSKLLEAVQAPPGRRRMRGGSERQ